MQLTQIRTSDLLSQSSTEWNMTPNLVEDLSDI